MGSVYQEMSADRMDALARQKERREREPLRYCKFIAKWPLQAFLLALSGHVLMILVSVGLVAFGYDLLPVDFEHFPLALNDLPWRPRDLAWTYRNQFNGFYDREPASVTGYRINSYPRSNIDLYYDAGNNNVFTKEHLKKIESTEKSIISVDKYQNAYCQLNISGTGCQNPLSIIRYFDGTYTSVDPVFNDPDFDNIISVLYEAYTNNATKGDFQFFLGNTSKITATHAYSPITRTVIPFGYPLDGYVDVLDYEKAARIFSITHMKPTLESIRENSELFTFSYKSHILWLEDVFIQATTDSFYAFGSISFIFVMILIHTQSLWVTAFAIFSILSSFVITNLIYRIVLDFHYIGFFHLLTLFIVLGIGADDIFVFYDIWRNTACESYPSLAHRLSDSFRKSVFSMLITSLTTSVAFFACALSPILITRSFGVFAGLVIIVNYISVIIYFPTVVIMFHTHFETFKWPCISMCRRLCHKTCRSIKGSNKDTTPHMERNRTYPKFINQNGSNSKPVEPHIVYPDVYIVEEETKCDTNVKQNSRLITTHNKTHNRWTDRTLHTDTKGKLIEGTINDAFELGEIGCRHAAPDLQKKSVGMNESEVVKKQKEKAMLVRFFRNKYSAFVTHKIIRWLILALMVGVLVFFALQASKLEPANEPLKVVKDSHVYSIAERHSLNSFVSSNTGNNMILYIVWGMLPNDMSDCHFSTPDCRGIKRWDSSFDPSTPEAQRAVQAMCDTMFAWSPETAADYHVRTDITTGQHQINCYIKNLESFLQKETANTGTDWVLPYNYSKTITFMDDRTRYYNSSAFSSDYKDYLEIPISYWLSNRYSYNHTEDFYLFDELIGEEEGEYSSALKTDPSRQYGNNIKYIAIQINTTMTQLALSYTDGIQIMTLWEEFVNDQMKDMPVGMNNAFQTTSVMWNWLISCEMLAKNAMYGLIIGVSLALPILIIATRNIITGFLATFSMCCSTVCVVGVITLGGWKFDMLVSLNLCMVVGLTVDYVVHLAEGYTLSLHKDRLSRVRDMLDEMGVSVFFGACTTLGGALFMFLAQLSFFLQFGVFIFSAVGFSIFFAMGMFVTLMGICGPQGDTGNIVVLVQRLQAWCKSKTNGDRPPSESNAQLVPAIITPSGNITSLAIW